MARSQKALVEAVPTQLLIGGRWRDSADGATLAVEDPATGSTLTRVADATAPDGTASKASGPSTPTPRQVPFASSSSATIGLTAVCHTTHWAPYSLIVSSLSATW